MSADTAVNNGRPPPPPKLPGYEATNRYFDSAARMWIAQVLPGDHYVTRNDEIISTVLGSCVSTCMRDPETGMGGINHFMLPEDPAGMRGVSARYGLFAMEQLINALMRRGARREMIEIKIAGGGRVIQGMGDVGRSNIDFVRAFLAAEQMPILVEDVGLDVARRLRYRPASGQMRVLHLPMSENHKIAKREIDLASRVRVLARRPVDVELF